MRVSRRGGRDGRLTMALELQTRLVNEAGSAGILLIELNAIFIALSELGRVGRKFIYVFSAQAKYSSAGGRLGRAVKVF
jgi:hypothetical protein